jgi:hypothetical protein
MYYKPQARLVLCASVLIGFLSSFTLQAQDASGRVIGTITDPQGAIVAGAKITVTNADTKVPRSTVTNRAGQYQILEIPIGRYTVTAEQPGFSKVVTDAQDLLINQSLRIDIAMKVGATSDTVQIEADASNIETVVATLGQSVTERAIVGLPLNGRNTLDLAGLQPGVLPANAGAGNTTGGGQEFTIAGGRPDSVTFLLDGGVNNNLLNNGVVFTPNPDSVSEFRLLTSNYTAEYGRNGGGVISEVIRSGTNSFHGSAYDFVRNNDFNANSFFNNLSGVGVPILKRNQFGATIGGPVLLPKLFNGRNKLFFFVSYQGQRQVSTTVNANVTTFTPAELGGDFSHSVKNGPDPGVVKFLQSNPYYQANPALAAQGIINPASFDVVARNYISKGLIPATASGLVLPQGNAQNNSDDLIEKVDYSPTTSDRFSVTLSSGRAPTVTPFGTSNVPGYATTSSLDRYHGVFDYSKILSPNMINDLRFTAQRNHSLGSVPATKLPTSNQLGINIISDNPSGPTDIGFASGLTVGFSVQGPTTLIDNTYDFSDVFTWTRGKHTMKYGFEWQPYQDNTNYDFYVNGQFFFSGTSGIGSGNDRADFLFGLPDEYLQYGQAPSNIRSQYYAGFGQDEWHVKSNLTLTFGLRYEYATPKKDLQGRTFSLQYGQQSKVFPGAPVGVLYPGDAGAPVGSNFPDRNNFAPRFGFAYSPGKDGKTSIRGGAGVFYDILKGEDNLQFNGQVPFAGFSDLFFNPPSGAVTGPLNLLSNPFVAAGQPNPFPSRPPASNINYGNAGFLPIGGAAVYFENPNLRTPYVYQYNLSVQRQLAHDFVLETSYVGSSSHKLTGLVDSNPYVIGSGKRLFASQPGASDANYSYLDTFDNVGKAHYNSLESSLQKRYSNVPFLGQMLFQLSYTYSHSIDNGSGFRENTSRVPYYNHNQFIGSSDYDLRHNLVFSGSWDLPFDRAWESGPKRLTQGWSFRPIITYRTGFPIDITQGIARTKTRTGPSGAGDPNLVRANLLTGSVSEFDPHLAQSLRGRTGNYYFDPNDFGRFADISNTNYNSYGSLGRNAFYGPGRVNADFTVAKNTKIAERLNMEFRADFFNSLNHAEFNNPSTSFTAGTFGQISSTASARIIQLAVHLTF